MKRIAAVVAALGLIGIAPSVRADEKSETKIEHKTDKKGASTTTERSSKHGGAKFDEKTDVDTHARADGKTETKKHTTKKSKVAGRMLPHRAESKEKTVRDRAGNVVEHEEKTSK